MHRLTAEPQPVDRRAIDRPWIVVRHNRVARTHDLTLKHRELALGALEAIVQTLGDEGDGRSSRRRLDRIGLRIAVAHLQPDERGLAFISRLPSLKDDVILRGVAQELESEGIMVIESTRFLSSLIPQEGALTTFTPDAQQWADIRLGVAVAREIGRWDIGQSVVVKRGTVLAVEGVEGTNATIRRGGELGGAGTVVVKVSKPQQDLRFDVPTVGPDTIMVMHEVQATVLALEAGKTLMLDKPRLLHAAETQGISVVALSIAASPTR